MKDATAAPSAALDLASAGIAVPGLAPPLAPGVDASIDLRETLPRDHPAWQRDVLAVSARVRALIAQLRPVTVRVLTFWDHTIRSLRLGTRHFEVDPSGCYRLR